MQQTTESHKHKQGFSLIELLVVMAIIAILMGIVIVGLVVYVEQSQAQMADMMTELEKYRGDEGQFPADWNEFRDWYVEKYPDTAYTITEGSPQNPIDPWGAGYKYEYNAVTSPFVYLLGTKGPDGRDGSPPTNQFGKGDDITNRNGAL
jgi:prepilin-type N-terminal cleavage/methylation domain-containing protein